MPARKKINLLPRTDFEYSPTGRFVNWAVSVGRWIVVFTELIVIAAFLSRFYFDTKLEILFEEIKQKKAIVDAALPFEKSFRTQQEKVNLAKQVLSAQKKPTSYFQEINNSMPDSIDLGSVSLQGNQIVIIGTTRQEGDIPIFVNTLTATNKFTQVAVQNIDTQKQDTEGIQFTVTAGIKQK